MTARVEEIAGMLKDTPTGIGRPIDDRAAWEEAAMQLYRAACITEAERVADEPIPEQPDELYLDYSRTGNRTRWQDVAFSRRRRIDTLTLAECLENRGRFVASLEAIIHALCAERTWVMPAHDRHLTNFNGRTHTIDLASSALAWELATVRYVLNDRLTPETRDRIARACLEQVVNPFMETLDGRRDMNHWMTVTNNWNAVCLAGVLGAALALVASPADRARCIDAAATYSKHFLSGFQDDGYCSEGLGYWNYGFGHYILLTETLLHATGGQLDLFAIDGVKERALFGLRTEIAEGVYPAFADCPPETEPSSAALAYVDRRYGTGMPAHMLRPGHHRRSHLVGCLLQLFPFAPSSCAPASGAAYELGLRTWFNHSGLLLSRPESSSRCHLAVALKGGSNAEHHNHNDLGSFIVVLNGQPVLIDPGAEEYTSRTFSESRYDGVLLNSYGHPVPVVAGLLQRIGNAATATVLRTHFTETADTLVLDLRSAYPVDTLDALTRTFVYSREGSGCLTVTDEVRFTRPQHFSTALVTGGAFEVQGPTRLAVRDGGEALSVHIDAGGIGCSLSAKPLVADARNGMAFTRLRIALDERVTAARVMVTIEPAIQA